MKTKGILAAFVVAVVLICTAYAIGQNRGYSRGLRGSSPAIVVKHDTVTTTKVIVDTVYKVRTITAYLPVVPDADEPMDTIDNPYDNPPDSAAVEIPISRYVAEQDSLYRVVAEGYAVDFKEITVYPNTVTITNTVEIRKPTHWGIGIQAGYGATLQGSTVKISPYIGVGISYNVASW